MLFSILIAHYNNFRYFKECYKSILEQSYQNFEIIIIDDCSTDNSLEQIEFLTRTDSRVKIFKNKINKGVGFTKKKCVEMSSGEICGFLDPDDALTKDALEISVKAFNRKKIVACYSQLYFCDENLNVQKIYKHSRQIKNNNPKFLNINFEVAHFFSFRKSVYLQTEGLNENYKVAEDQDLILKIYEKGSFKFIKRPLYYYRIHNKGLSHDQSKIALRQKTWHTVLIKALERRKTLKIYNKLISQIDNLPEFIFKKQNTFFAKITRKIS